MPDDEAAITAALERGAATCDAVLSTGGVSMGDIDLVKVVLDRIGDMRWMQVAIRPAKPLAFGLVTARAGGRRPGVPVFGLPGNPVSSMVSFELFARPGAAPAGRATPTSVCTARGCGPRPASRSAVRPDGKIHFVRVVVTADPGAAGGLRAASSGGQGSHQLAAMARADGLAVLPDGDGVAAGDPVEVHPAGRTGDRRRRHG